MTLLRAMPLLLAASLHAQPRFVNVGDASLRYESIGRGRAVVFIHGWAQDLGTWDDQARAFSSGYRVIRYDVRGFGQSTGFADVTADPGDLRALLDSLGVRAAYIVGLSRGATVALSFAIAFPDRVAALVLYGTPPPAGFQPTAPDPLVRAFAQIAKEHGLDSLGRAVFNSPLVWHPDDQTASERRTEFEQFMVRWRRYRGRDLLDPKPPSGRTPPPSIGQVSDLHVPVLIVHGDHEMPLFQQVADTLVERIPGARKVVITNGGHGAHFYNPAQFNAALMDFFRQASTPR